MKFSVITINRNNALGLEKTIRSVLQQSFKQFEYIIVDGASTDGSVDVIKENIASFSSESNPKVQWLSEADMGIYNAMNKGIRMASGDYLLFLNSGDAFCNEHVLENVLPTINNSDIVIGKVNVVNADGTVQKDVELRHKDITLLSLYLYGVPHQATFINRVLFDGCIYDESLKINADWKFFLQTIIMQNTSVQAVPVTIADYDGTGISSTNKELLLKEREQIFREVVPERIASDYARVFPHYYEVYRIEWLLKHRFFYKLYRLAVSIGMKLMK